MSAPEEPALEPGRPADRWTDSRVPGSEAWPGSEDSELAGSVSGQPGPVVVPARQLVLVETRVWWTVVFGSTPN